LPGRSAIAVASRFVGMLEKHAGATTVQLWEAAFVLRR
jgi:hypothetical protein